MLVFPGQRIFKERRESTYGDEFTPRAISNVYGVELRIVYTLGQNEMVDITPDNLSRGLITIGHYHEENEIHYVVLNKEIQNRSDEPRGDSDTQLSSLSSNVYRRNNKPQSESDTQLGSPLSNVDIRNNGPQRGSDTQLGSPSSNVDMRKGKSQSESDKQLGSPSSNLEKSSKKYVIHFNWLPSEIVELIFLYFLSVSDFTFPGNVC